MNAQKFLRNFHKLLKSARYGYSRKPKHIYDQYYKRWVKIPFVIERHEFFSRYYSPYEVDAMPEGQRRIFIAAHMKALDRMLPTLD